MQQLKSSTKRMIRTDNCLVVLILLALFASCSKSSEGDTDDMSNEITYEYSTDIFPNPERGFMHLYSATSEGTGLNLASLKAQRNENISLLHRLYYLDEFKDKPLSAAQLSLIREDMSKVREAGMKCILRFAYTDEMEGADAPYAIIEQHLDQLKGVFEENQDIIAFVQAGFIGAWGEWHSSSNGLSTPENKRKVLFKLLEVLPAHLMVQVRTPVYKQEIFSSTVPVNATDFTQSNQRSRVGHHNDCFLSNATDYGTYINVDAEKNYIRNEALYVPVGGETCPPTDGYNPNCSTGRTQMEHLRWTYMNLDWYKPTVDAWRASGCFDEFQRNIGYRLSLTSAKLADQAKAGQDYKVDILVSNRGYAPLYHQKKTNLVLKNISTNAFYEVELPVDLRSCKPNLNFQISTQVRLQGIPAGDYTLFLKISDQAASLQNRAEYAVRLANKDGWVAENGGMNSLKHELTITN